MGGDMKFDKTKIGKILSDIERYQRDLNKLKIKTPSELRKMEKFYTSSMLIFSLVNSAIDLGNEIISAKKLELPTSYREIFEILEKNKIIDKKTKDALIELVRVRNAIAHRYFLITPTSLFKSLKKIWSTRKFANKVKELIKS
jgi:uncharacterized protein YutE (UPF0331/DUF86 family)